MAYADYYHCDKCDCKAFYDANLGYYEEPGDDRYNEHPVTGKRLPDGDVGDMKVLCRDRRENLRICTSQQNNWNRRSNKNCSVPEHKGVYKTKDGKYAAHITRGGGTQYLGRFNTAEGAANAYKREAKVIQGEYACQH